MPSDERDEKFERALAQHLRGGASEAKCPDAEILSAYHERELSLEEMAHWKQHIAGCAACQETLALVEATEKELAEAWGNRDFVVTQLAAAPNLQSAGMAGEASALPEEAAATTTMLPKAQQPRKSTLLKWSVPLGAVAAGILVWIGIHEQRKTLAPSSAAVQVAQNQPAAPRDQNFPASEPQQNELRKLEKNSPPSVSDSESKRLDRDAFRERSNQKGAAADGKLDSTLGDKVSPKEISTDGAPAPAPPKPVAAPKGEISGVESNAAAPVPGDHVAYAPPPAPVASRATGAAVSGVAGARPAESDEKNKTRAEKDQGKKQAQAEVSANLDTSAMMSKQSGVTMQSVQVTALEPGLILTPDSKIWWKAHAAGKVELTTDGGKKWKSKKTGVASDLLSGSAPSADVCWIAGKSGTLLLTVDRGAHWSKLSTPISGDLGGVHAADALHASIWDATNHQSYETSDGGLTWKQAANE